MKFDIRNLTGSELEIFSQTTQNPNQNMKKFAR